MSTNSISVIIPSYNSAHFLERSINSVLHQTLQPDEIIIIDDGSTDNTKQILTKKFQKRVTVISQENRGEAAARNAGITAATSTWIALLDADDYWQPEKLEKQMKLLDKMPDADWISCNYYYERIGRNAVLSLPNQNLYYKNGLEALTAKSASVHSSTIILKRKLMQAVGTFDTQLYSGADIDYWARYGSQFPKLAYSTDALATYCNNPQSVTKKNIVRRLEDAQKKVMKHGGSAKHSLGNQSHILDYIRNPVLNTIKSTFGLCSTKHHRHVISAMKSSKMHVPLYIQVLSYIPYPIFRIARKIYNAYRY